MKVTPEELEALFQKGGMVSYAFWRLHYDRNIRTPAAARLVEGYIWGNLVRDPILRATAWAEVCKIANNENT